MKVSGTAEIAGEREQVFSRLLDPDVLRRCIPGCESLDKESDGTYRITVKAGVGAVKGRFDGQVSLSDVSEPDSYRMGVEGKSTVGHIRGEALIRLEADGDSTKVAYEGDAKVSGLIATVGGRLIGAAAKKVAGDFFERLEQDEALKG